LIEVADDGQGFGVTSGDGVGLANVRERLNACYGERARLTLASNALAGVTARLHIPAGLACA
jgi:signal transduction histidine kinase